MWAARPAAPPTSLNPKPWTLPQTHRGGGAGRKASGTPYIRISEAEIADDYPLPAQYDKVEEEVDELVLADEDVLLGGVDPESLPRRLLSDFDIYNAEVGPAGAWGWGGGGYGLAKVGQACVCE